MKNKSFTLSVIFILITVFAFGQNRKEISHEKQSEISSTLNAFTRNISSIYASFVQEKVFSFMEDKLIAQGEFWFATPDKIRWEYEKPYPYKFRIDDLFC